MESGFPERAADLSDSTARGKRGRKSSLPDPADGPVARFAHELCLLKRAAGDPSYDRMRSELGAAASKSALSAAARGQTLPSWETTWEFVRCLAVVKLGRDEQVTKNEWRGRWEHAGAADADPDQVVPEAPADTSETAASASGREPAEAPPGRRGLSAPTQAGAAAILVAVLGVILVGFVLANGSSRPTGTAPPTGPDYPIPGDDSGFGTNGSNGDVTVPDGSVFRVGDDFVKIWRLNNLGEVTWKGRFLQAFGDTSHLCASPERVPIPRTEPGELVDVRVPVTAKRPGHCKVEWKMVDAQGRLFFPTQKRSVFYEVIIRD